MTLDELLRTINVSWMFQRSTCAEAARGVDESSPISLVALTVQGGVMFWQSIPGARRGPQLLLFFLEIIGFGLTFYGLYAEIGFRDTGLILAVFGVIVTVMSSHAKMGRNLESFLSAQRKATEEFLQEQQGLVETTVFEKPTDAIDDLMKKARHAVRVKNTFLVPSTGKMHNYKPDDMLKMINIARDSAAEWRDVFSSHLLVDSRVCMSQREDLLKTGRYTLGVLAEDHPFTNFTIVNMSADQGSYVWFGWRNYAEQGQDAVVVRSSSAKLVDYFESQWSALLSRASRYDADHVYINDVAGTWVDWLEGRDSTDVLTCAVLVFECSSGELTISGHVFALDGRMIGEMKSRSVAFRSGKMPSVPRVDLSYVTSFEHEVEHRLGDKKDVRGHAVYEIRRQDGRLVLSGEAGDASIGTRSVKGVKLSDGEYAQWKLAKGRRDKRQAFFEECRGVSAALQA